jgi:hypothetical protein
MEHDASGSAVLSHVSGSSCRSDRGTLDQLRTYATSNGVSASELAASLLETIAEDDLYNAVLNHD